VSFNVLTLVISLGIILLARTSVGGSDTSTNTAVIATLISNFIVFVTGYVTLVVAPGPQAMENAKKWGTFFVMMWLTSLILLVLADALPFWLQRTPFTTQIIDAVFGRGEISPTSKDVLRAAFFGILAIVILLIKTKRMDPNFKIASVCSLITCACGLLVNMLLMGGFVYGHIV